MCLCACQDVRVGVTITVLLQPPPLHVSLEEAYASPYQHLMLNSNYSH